jgi:hypothetical protein
MSGIIVGIPPAVLDLVQQGVLERTFHDGLYPKLQFRSEAMAEEWPANTGTEMFMTRPGLLTPVTEPMVAGVDPTPQTVNHEQWVARLARYSSAIDTHAPTSVVSNANQFLRNINQLGLQAGMSVNRIARNELFKAYLSGHTLTTAAVSSGDLTVPVASLNGFTDVIILGTNTRPETVSPTRPLPIKIGIGSARISRNVVGFTPTDPTDPYGPGSIVLDVAIPVSGFAARTAVVSDYAPRIIRAGGGASIDAITSSDTFVFQLIINAMNYLRSKNVPPHSDGLYHAHIGPLSNSQIYNDQAWQRLHTACPDHIRYKEGFLGIIGRTMFYENTEVPDSLNAGARTATGTNAFYSRGIGSETTNESGVDIGRIIVTGRGSIYERYLDEMKYITEAGVTGKVGEFSVANNGIQVALERIRLVLRSPIDRLMDIVSAAWSCSTSFPVPSDISAGGPERFKRAVVIEHAL